MSSAPRAGEPGSGGDAEEAADVGAQPHSSKNADPQALEWIREVEELVESVANTGFEPDRPPELPQPDRARSVADLPKVKSSAFRRLLR